MADIQIHQGGKYGCRTVSVQAVIVFGFPPTVLHPVKSIISVILFCLLQQIFVVPLFIRICHAAGNAKPGYRHIDCQFCNGNTKGSFPQTAKAAIAEMVRQQPRPVFAWEEKRGEDVPKEACEGAVMKQGVIVRQLLLPGCLKDARNIVRYLYETYQNKIYVSLMSQYTPLEHVRDYPELAHRVSRRTYDRYVDAAIALGITQAFIQEPGVAKESFIPDFSNAEGV